MYVDLSFTRAFSISWNWSSKDELKIWPENLVKKATRLNFKIFESDGILDEIIFDKICLLWIYLQSVIKNFEFENLC